MMKRNVMVIKEIDVFPEYCPKVGYIYEAEYSPACKTNSLSKGEFCIIDILDKRIILRSGEFIVLGS